ncbi:MAG: phycobilisome protein [Microcystaceae cyanobacterium]
MHKNFEALTQMAEDHYLRGLEMQAFQLNLASLKERLALYKLLRDQEIELFQPIADYIVKTFATEDEKHLEILLKHWIAVMRYGSMAMLLNNPEFLQRRLLEWLSSPIAVHQTQAIERKIYGKLQENLAEVLTDSQLALINPFLSQAETVLLNADLAQEAEALL